MEQESAKILRFAGIKDVWSTSDGNRRTSTNFIGAVVDALRKLTSTKIKPDHAERVAYVAGNITGEASQ